MCNVHLTHSLLCFEFVELTLVYLLFHVSIAFVNRPIQASGQAVDLMFQVAKGKNVLSKSRYFVILWR